MKKMVYVACLVVVITIVFSACASLGVSLQGKNYFVNKTESDLVKYFAYEGDSVEGTGEYDRIVYFTARVDTFEMSKTTVQQYKVSNSQNIFSFSFSEHNDGCWVNHTANSYHYKNGTYGVGPKGRTVISPPQHRNDNALVKSNIARFNSEVERLDAVSRDKRQATFDRTSIGSWFFIYGVDKTSGFRSYALGFDEGIPSAENFSIYTYTIWRINVAAEDRATTEKHIAATYEERSDKFYDNSGNVISKEQVQAICDDYVKKGFKSNTLSRGLSVRAYIKDGKIVKVE